MDLKSLINIHVDHAKHLQGCYAVHKIIGVGRLCNAESGLFIQSGFLKSVFFKEKICINFKVFSLSYVWCKSVKNTVSHKLEIQFLFILFYYLLFMCIGVCLQCMCEGVGCN